MLSAWYFVTDFGDSAVTAPLALLTFGFLLGSGERRLASGWVLAVGGCAIAIGLLKLVLGACGSGLTMVYLVSPSGHTAMSTVVYGGLALLIGSRFPPARRRAILATGAVAIIAIAASRVALHDHSRSEIAVGFIVGAVAVGVFRVVLGRVAAPALPLGWLVLCGALVIAVMHGTRWIVEPTVQHLAWDFRLLLPWCR